MTAAAVRRLHRWVATICLIFIMLVALSGTVLAVDQTAAKLPIATRPPQAPLPLRDAQIIALFDRATAVRHAALRAVPLTSIKVRNLAGAPQAIYWTDEALPFARVFDLNSGLELTPEGEGLSRFVLPWRWHQIVKRVHNGSLLGIPGRVFDALIGLALCFLALTGVKIYLELYLDRCRKGRRSLFWR